MDVFQDPANEIRSNLIEILLRLYQKFEAAGEEVHLKFEKYELHFVVPKGLWVEGCIDKIHIKDNRYSSVTIGDRIREQYHVPISWLRSLDGEV